MKTYEIRISMLVASLSLCLSGVCASEKPSASEKGLSEADAQRSVKALIAKLERTCKPCPLCLRKIVERGVDPKMKWGGAITREALNKFDFVARSAYRNVEDDVERDLAKLGPPAVAALGEILKSKDGRTASVIAKALAKIGDKSAVPGLIEAMQDKAKQFSARLSCAISLSHFDGPAAIPVLISGLRITSELLVIEGMVRAEFDEFEIQDAINLRVLRNEASSLRRLCLDALVNATRVQQKVEPKRRLAHLLESACSWERWWAHSSAQKGLKEGAAFTFKTLYLDPWGNEVWMARRLSARSERRDLQDQILLMGVEKYIHDFGKAKSLKALMARLTGFNCGLSAYPAGLSDSNKYSFKGFVKISDKILEYKYEKDTSRWVYSGMMWMGVPGEEEAAPIP